MLVLLTNVSNSCIRRGLLCPNQSEFTTQAVFSFTFKLFKLTSPLPKVLLLSLTGELLYIQAIQVTFLLYQNFNLNGEF